MIKKRNYQYEGTIYEGTITFKRIRHLILKMGKGENEILISAPYATLLRTVDSFVIKNLPKLLKKVNRVETPFGESYLYLLGNKQEFAGGEKEAHALWKKEGKPYLEERVRRYEGLMGIQKPYQVKMRNMKSRWGVNSKTAHALTFSDFLMCFTPEIIDSVVVHELCHHFHFDHSKEFYDLVFRYCPEYKKLHRCLTRRIYDGRNSLPR